MNTNQIVEKIANIKANYTFEYCGTIGKFNRPHVHMSVCQDRYYVADDIGGKSEIVIGNVHSGDIVEKILLDSIIESFTYCETKNCILVTYKGSSAIWKYDLNNKRSTLFNKNDSQIGVALMRSYPDGIYASSPRAHTVQIFDFEGTVRKVYDCKDRFPYPWTFCKVSPDRLILLRCMISEAIQDGLQQGIAILDTGKDAMTVLKTERIEAYVDMLQYTTWVETDVREKLYLKNNSTFVKLDDDYKVLFRIDIAQMIPGYSEKKGIFYAMSIHKQYLYILETGECKAIFKFKIGNFS